MRILFAFLAVFVSSCSGVKWHPVPVKEAKSKLVRGWSYAESAKEFEEMEAGAPQAGSSSIVLAGEKLIFGSDRFGLVALNRFNGRKLWQKRFRDGISASPVVFQDKIFVGSDDARFFCLDLSSGAELWQIPLNAPSIGTPIFVEGRLITATADEAVYALDPASGKQLWAYKRPTFSSTSIKGGGNANYISGKIWIGFSDGALLALDPNDGSVKLEKQFHDNLKFPDIDAKPLPWKDGVLVNSYDGKLRYLSRDGAELWSFPAGGARAPVLVEDRSTLILPSSDGAVYSLSADTAKEGWRYILRRGVPTGLAVFGKESLVVAASSEEKVYLLDLNSGKELGHISLGRGSGTYAANIAVDPEKKYVYILSSFSRVYQLKIQL